MDNHETIVTQPDRHISGKSSLAKFALAGTVAIAAVDYFAGGAVGELSSPVTKVTAGLMIGAAGLRGAKAAAGTALDVLHDTAVKARNERSQSYHGAQRQRRLAQRRPQKDL